MQGISAVWISLLRLFLLLPLLELLPHVLPPVVRLQASHLFLKEEMSRMRRRGGEEEGEENRRGEDEERGTI